MKRAFIITMLMVLCVYLIGQANDLSVYVDPYYTGEEIGTIEHPYSTVDNALYAIRNEVIPYSLILSPGTYPPIEIVGYNHPRTIRSLYTPGNDQYIANTIVEGDATHPAIRLQDCGSISIIGLSLRNGNGYYEVIFEANGIDFDIARSGGGISTKNIQKLQVLSCDISNNVAFAGAGIYLDVSNLMVSEIKNCKIHNNTLLNMANWYEIGGAGIFIKTGKVIIDSSLIYNNNGNASFSWSGAITNEGGASNGMYKVKDCDVTISNTQIYGNQTYSNGSALFFSFNYENALYGFARLKIISSNFVDNYCSTSSYPA